MSEILSNMQNLYNLKANLLDEQFARFLNQQEIYKSKNSTEVEYKNIYCKINIRNKRKKQTLDNLIEELTRTKIKNQNIQQHNSSSYKFQKLQNSTASSMINSKRINKSLISIPSIVKFQNVEQAIYSQKMINESLLLHLQEQKTSLNRIRGEIKVLNQKNRLINRKMQKLKTVQNVSNCQRIYSAFCVNKAQKDYSELVKNDHKQQQRFMDMSKSLKKSEEFLKKQYLRKECKKDELQRINNVKAYQLKKLEKTNTQKKQNIIKLVNSIETLIKLIQQNQPQFQQIILQECVKPRNILKFTNCMSQQKINQIKFINKFQQNHNFKIQTSDRLIVNIFHRLKQLQKIKVIQFDEIIQLHKQLEDELKELIGKQRSIKEEGLSTLSSSGQINVNDENIILQERMKQSKSQIDNLVEGIISKSEFYMNLIQFLQGNLLKLKNFFCLLIEWFGEKKCEQIFKNLKQILSTKNKINKTFMKSNQQNKSSIIQFFKEIQKNYTQQKSNKQIFQPTLQSQKSINLFIFSKINYLIQYLHPNHQNQLKIIEALFQYSQQQFHQHIKIMFDSFIKSIKFIKFKSLQMLPPTIQIKTIPFNKHQKAFYSQFLSDNNQQFQLANQAKGKIFRQQLNNEKKGKQVNNNYNQSIISKLLKISKTQLMPIYENLKNVAIAQKKQRSLKGGTKSAQKSRKLTKITINDIKF